MVEELSREEQLNSWMWWKKHISRLEERDILTRDELYALKIHVADLNNIGYGDDRTMGMIRPGKFGQWDVFYILEMWGIPYEKRLLLADLSDSEVQQQTKDDKMRANGFDPDNSEDKAEFERIDGMTTEQINAERKRLEALLAEN